MMPAGHARSGTAALAAAVFLCVPSAASAQNSKQSCTILVTDNGTMRQNAGANVLSSSQPGAQSGAATVVTTNGSYSLSVDAPFGFSMQPAGAAGETRFEASMSATGATQFFSVPSGTEQRIKRGQTDVSVDFRATRLTGSFPAGQYKATVVLRCE